MAASAPDEPLRTAARNARIAVSATSAMLMKAGEARADGLRALDFGVGEPDFATPEHIQEAGIRAIRDGFTKYTPVGGMAETRRAVVEAHARDFGSAYTPEQAMVTVGGKQALFDALSTLVDHGDEVILPAPYWGSFRDQITYAGGVPVIVPCYEADGFTLAPRAVEAALSPRTRVLVCNSPANPSGAVMPPGAVAALLEICHRRGLWMISDECYARFLYEGRPYSAGSAAVGRERLIIAGSLSKTYAMTGWRFGYGLGPAPVLQAMLKLQSHSTGSLAGFVQKAAIAALLGPQEPVARMLAEYRRRRDRMVAGLRAVAGVSCTLPAGAFYAFPNVRGLMAAARTPTASAFAAKLFEQAGLITVGGDAFGTDGHIRLSYATSMATIEEGLDRLERHAAGLLH